MPYPAYRWLDLSSATYSLHAHVASLYIVLHVFVEGSMTSLVLNLDFAWLPRTTKLSQWLAGDMMGEIGCLYESQPTLAQAGRLARCLVPPETRHARALHNPLWHLR